MLRKRVRPVAPSGNPTPKHPMVGDKHGTSVRTRFAGTLAVVLAICVHLLRESIFGGHHTVARTAHHVDALPTVPTCHKAAFRGST